MSGLQFSPVAMGDAPLGDHVPYIRPVDLHQSTLGRVAVIQRGYDFYGIHFGHLFLQAIQIACGDIDRQVSNLNLC